MARREPLGEPRPLSRAVGMGRNVLPGWNEARRRKSDKAHKSRLDYALVAETPRFVETREKRLFGGRLELTGMRVGGTDPVELAFGRVRGEPYLLCCAVRNADAKRAKGDLHRLADEQSALGPCRNDRRKNAQRPSRNCKWAILGTPEILTGGTEQTEVWT
jgi:hypothetical protein